jgi:hypothetical protein
VLVRDVAPLISACSIPIVDGAVSGRRNEIATEFRSPKNCGSDTGRGYDGLVERYRAMAGRLLQPE